MTRAWMRWSWWGERTPQLQGQLLLLAVLAAAFYLSGEAHCCTVLPDRQPGPLVTLLSPLPPSWLGSEALFEGLRIAFFVGAGLWLCQLALPHSSWLATLAFTALIALHQEQLPYVDHVFQLTNALLFVLAIWYQASSRALREALGRGDFWQAPLLPRWVPALALVTVGMFYTRAGLGKLLTAGPGWADGLSLQLWVSIWGRPGWWSDQILANRGLATASQAAVLAAQCAALFALPFRWPRALVGLGLVLFHLGQWLVFGWAFQANLLLVTVTLLPVGAALAALCARGARRFAGTRSRPTTRWGRAFIARIDVLGMWTSEIR